MNKMEQLLEAEMKVLAEMGLPDGCLALDGDRVLAQGSYKATDQEMDDFKAKVESLLTEDWFEVAKEICHANC